ncbi:MAG: hypothetical protein J3R72DRAFT_181009 [Linnemannia gamsii]|nr:MAG: hypothetical protein J3R72DRAFT_181009 [Linnemannia gamsii]
MKADTMSTSSTHPHPYSRNHHNNRQQQQQQQQQQYQQNQQEYPCSNKICCISLHDVDKVRLINIPTSLISPLRFAIFESWDRPIQQETCLKQCQGYEFKLKGRPWSCSPKNPHDIASQKVILALLRVMEMRGWFLILASNVRFRREEKDALFFEWAGPKGLMPSSSSSSSRAETRLLPRLSRWGEGPFREEEAQKDRSSWEKDLDGMTVVDESDRPVEGDDKDNDSLEGEEDGEGEGEAELFAVDISESDVIRVIEAPVVLITAIRHAILRHWKQGWVPYPSMFAFPL